MRFLIDLLRFSLHMRGKPNKYHNTRNSYDSDDSHDSNPCIDKRTFEHKDSQEIEMQERQLDEALRENDEMFLRVIAVGNGVKELFTAQEANAMSLLAARYDRGDFYPQQ